MGKPIELPDITGVMKAIEVILDPEKSKDYAAALKSQIEHYQSLVDEYRRWKAVDDATAEAVSKRATADLDRAAAAKELEDAKAKAESIVKAAMSKEFDISRKLKEREAQLKGFEASLNTARDEVSKLRNDLAKERDQAKELHDKAAQTMQKALALQAEF